MIDCAREEIPPHRAFRCRSPRAGQSFATRRSIPSVVSRSRRLRSGDLFEPVGVMQSAEHGRADELHILRQSMRILLQRDGQTLRRVRDPRSETGVQEC